MFALSLPAPALALDVDSLSGTWRGERDGVEVVWQLEQAGRLRVDGRPASWTVRNDSLFVEFDPDADSGADGERAVYQFQASEPGNGRRSLFVYGFDLGFRGVLLGRDCGLVKNEPAALASQAAAATSAPVAARHPVQRSTGAGTSNPVASAPAQRAADPVAPHPKKTP